MSPKDMRRLSMAPSDFIRVETRRGVVEVKVRADRDVPENMVFMPFCYAEAAANLLTNPALDPFGMIPEFKFCAARVERVSSQGRSRVACGRLWLHPADGADGDRKTGVSWRSSATTASPLADN